MDNVFWLVVRIIDALFSLVVAWALVTGRLVWVGKRK